MFLIALRTTDNRPDAPEKLALIDGVSALLLWTVIVGMGSLMWSLIAQYLELKA